MITFSASSGRVPSALRAVSVTLGLALAASGCGGDGGTVRRAAEATGIVDAAPLPPRTGDAVCDWTLGAPCTPERFRATVQAELSHLSTAPGSSLRAWGFGRDVGTCRPYTTVTVPEVEGSDRERAVAREAFVTATTDRVMTAMAPLFAEARASRSPILEAVTKVATTSAAGRGERAILALSEGLQSSVTVGDWECLPIEPVPTLLPRLTAARILEPGSLRGVALQFCFFDPSVIDQQRCPSVIGRALTVTDTWRSLARHAGARSVTFSPGLPVLGEAANLNGGAP